jgi:hypothetical protein
MPQITPMNEARWRALPTPSDQVRHLPLPAGARKLRLFGCRCLRRCADWLSPEGRAAVEAAERFAHGRATDAERLDAFRRLVEGCGGYVGPHAAGRPWCTATLPRDFVARAVALVVATPEEELFDAENGLPLTDVYEDVKQIRRVAQSCDIARALAVNQARSRSDEFRRATGRTWRQLLRAAFGARGSAPDEIIIRQEFDHQFALVRDVFGNPFRSVAFSPDWRTDTVLALARQVDESCDFATMPILADALQDAGCTEEDVLHHCRSTIETHGCGCWAIDLIIGQQ